MSDLGDTANVAAEQAVAARPLIIALRVLGVTDMLALMAVAMPTAWIQVGHQWCGLGDFPDAPIAAYLARSASALYALHGLVVVYMSFDVRRYWPLIRLLASMAVVHGVIMWGIDRTVGMPAWWTAFEGPAFSATGLIVLLAQYWSKRRALRESSGDEQG